jgi:peptidyl-tRNA hydrolase, PTH1 family
MRKFLIAGLGNIGDEYANTRHNIGFRIAEVLAASLQKEEPATPAEKLFHPDKLVTRAETKYRGKSVIIIKPTTYMNLSGKAVSYWMQAEKITLENILVVTDDLALPFGKLRLKKKGGAGGHNGLGDIITMLNTEEWPRLRFGIGSDFSKGRQVDHVLSRWSDEEMKVLPERIDEAVQIIKSFLFAGIEKTMTAFNSK